MNAELKTMLPFSGDIPPEIEADARAVVESLMAGRPVDPEVARRVRVRSKAITEELRANYGELDIGVRAIRELRGELPE